MTTNKTLRNHLSITASWTTCAQPLHGRNPVDGPAGGLSSSSEMDADTPNQADSRDRSRTQKSTRSSFARDDSFADKGEACDILKDLREMRTEIKADFRDINAKIDAKTSA
jgi:hypothetical protein